MEGEIVNRVANSVLKTFDLEEYYPKGVRVGVDISQWLESGFLLREKPFRDSLKEHQWDDYKDTYVYLFCSTDAIVPAWAYMLITTYLNSFARKIVVGDAVQLETAIFQEELAKADLEAYRDKPVIIKGCSKLPVPPSAYIWILQKLQDVASRLLYGEACSSVPLYKR
ncbi:DUF2480 family protein [Robiginitalea sp. IMCC43444]|uniref:DUF2480 family protein n=1 Tax=Robiginitalea sp. IMCC43444 TaxID=3459121 RepID=UPI004040FF18